MIKQLAIKNFVLIENAEFDFEDNLNILIGETGGGKSLVFRAINQILGERANNTYIQKGKNYYEISAVFTNSKQIEKALKNEGITLSDNLYIYRYFEKNGTTKITINGELVSLNRLKKITDSIADIVLQKENNQQLDEDFLFDLIDISSELYEKYKKQFKLYTDLIKELRKLECKQNNKEEELLVINHRLKQFAKLDENIDLLAAQSKIASSEEIIENTKKYERITQGLDKALSSLQFEKGIDEKISDQLYSIKDNIENLSFELSTKTNLEISAEEINHLREQVSIAKKLSRQFDCNVDELGVMKLNLISAKEQVDSIEIDLENLKSKVTKCITVLDELWKELKVEIEIKSSKIEKAANKMLKDVEMPKAHIRFKFTEQADYTVYGKNEITLEIDANGLNQFGNINEHASGGEFSRILLILKTLDPKNKNRLLLFDEIDTGISGYTAQRMIKLIQQIAKNNQILLITHLAQSAAAANCMYEITKKDGTSKAIKITNTKMPLAISKLLSGEKITDEAILQAKNLIKEVQNG